MTTSTSPFEWISRLRRAKIDKPKSAASDLGPAIPTAGIGSDIAEFETQTADPAAMARAIIAAGELARSGGHPPEKISDAAAAIIVAGKRRRGEQ